MMKKEIRQIIKRIYQGAAGLALVTGLLLGSMVPAAAKEGYSLTIVPKEGEQELSEEASGTFTVYKVSDELVPEGDTFVLVNGFQNSDVRFSMAQLSKSHASYAAALAKYIADGGRVSFVKDDLDKGTRISLDKGLYLVVQKQKGDGYRTLSPFLVFLPSLQEDGSISYDVVANPKGQKETPPPTTPPDEDTPGENTPPDNPERVLGVRRRIETGIGPDPAVLGARRAVATGDNSQIIFHSIISVTAAALMIGWIRVSGRKDEKYDLA